MPLSDGRAVDPVSSRTAVKSNGADHPDRLLLLQQSDDLHLQRRDNISMWKAYAFLNVERDSIIDYTLLQGRNVSCMVKEIRKRAIGCFNFMSSLLL